MKAHSLVAEDDAHPFTISGANVALMTVTGGIGASFDTVTNTRNAIRVKADTFVGSADNTAFNVWASPFTALGNVTLGSLAGINVAGFDADGIIVAENLLKTIATTGNNLAAQIKTTAGGVNFAKVGNANESVLQFMEWVPLVFSLLLVLQLK